MARTKIKRRTYNLGNIPQTENSSRPAERVPNEAPVQDGTTTIALEDTMVQQAPPEDTMVQQVPPEDTMVQQVPPEDTMVQQEPPEDTTVQQEPPEDTTVQQEPPEDTTVQQEPPEDTMVQQEPPENTTVQQEPPQDTTVLQEALEQPLELQAASEPILQQQAPPPSVFEDSKGANSQGDTSPSGKEENDFVPENRSTATPIPQENDDSNEMTSPIFEPDQDTSDSHYEPNYEANDDLTISRDSPLNLVCWDSATKEQALSNGPNFRPVTPEHLMHIPVDEIFSPTTQKEIRTTIRALFPNGPPPPPPVRPIRRPKKGDTPYIVGCTNRRRVPSPTSLSVFRGDQYGITSATNCDEEDQCSPAKRGRRGPHSGMSLSKSRFNPQSNEIAERLKLYEKIDRLLGRTPKEQPVGYMTSHTVKRSFSPLPSTSTDNETIMKNDKHFSESLNCDNFDINDDDDDDELPEVYLDPAKLKHELHTRNNSPISGVGSVNGDSKSLTDNVLLEINEDINNNNNDDYCEIQFDKYFSKEKVLDYSDVENSRARREPEGIDSMDGLNRPRDLSFTATTDFSVDVTFSTPNNNAFNPASTSVLRASNRIATATETRQSDLVIEVPDNYEPLNMSCQASTSRLPAWHEDVQFVSEDKSNVTLPNEDRENIADVQIVSQSLANSQATIRMPAEVSLQFLIDFESYARRKYKKKAKRQRTRENDGDTDVNNENTAPFVNQPALEGNIMSPPTAPAPQAGGKRLGECPICLDSLPTGSIASTNCGHVFCLDCIKQSLKTSGKRCPTCRKQLRGVGYHQVFL